jgi:subtilisin-like proprotein convertase family protein
MKRIALVTTVALFALVQAAQADFTLNFSSGFQNGGVIPDGSMTGWSDTRALSGYAGTISSVSVGLNLSGGWNGDLYAYLVHDTGFAVLLNRVGRTADKPSGYSTAGMNVMLSDAIGLGNIHSVALPASGGTYQIDGRNISPLSSGALFDTTDPANMLSSFAGGSANGAWTLFIADVSGGDVSTLQDWTLDVTLAAVPEPASLIEGTVAALFLGGIVSLYRLKGMKQQPVAC